MSKGDLAILRDARELISDPARWTQGELAKDAQGDEVAPLSPQAACWCLEGAIAKAADIPQFHANGDRGALWTRLAEICKAKFDEFGLWVVNDQEGHAAVLSVLDAAIVDLEAEAHS